MKEERPEPPYEAERVEKIGKGISEGGKICMEISDLSQNERRPGPDSTLPQLHDAEYAKGDDLEEQVQSEMQLPWKVPVTRQ